jgi:uncharacterized membrane protein
VARAILLTIAALVALFSLIGLVSALFWLNSGTTGGLILVPLVGLGLAGWLARVALTPDPRPASELPVHAATPLPAEAETFLATLEGRLGLPAETRTEVRAELSDHLADSIASLQAEGLDEGRATREALARLGRPEELASQIRRAHQTTSRLLAGAAGGVFQAGMGTIWGAVVGFVLFILVSILSVTLLKPVFDFVVQKVAPLESDTWALGLGSIPGAAVACVAAFTAGRWSVRALIRTSQRPASQVARWWALGGGLLLAYFVVFRVTAQQSWLIVPFELLIPVAFVVGVLFRTERRLPLDKSRSPSLLIVMVLALGPVSFLFAAPVQSGETATWGTDYTQERADFDRVAPAWTGEDPVYGGGALHSSGLELKWTVADPEVLAGFSALRFEVWRAVPFPGAPDWVDDYIPAPAYSEPFATTPAINSRDGGMGPEYVTATFDLSHVRTSRWIVFLTGIGPDGDRYRFGMPASALSPFSGTVWDWLTASE